MGEYCVFDALGYTAYIMSKHGPREVVVFNGRKYGRYPEHPRKTHRLYYCAGGNRWLHRDTWIFHNGPIPSGMDIHHIDENPLNNDISNLEMVEHGAHRHMHLGPETVAKLRQNMAKAQNAAKAWHSSAEGREWHRRMATGRRKRALFERVCGPCGKVFFSKTTRGLYCSDLCQGRKRVADRRDWETRACVMCGTEYRCEKHQPTRTCTRRCSANYRWQKGAGLRSNSG